jgi:outer membrane protein assembly factor BamE (lipoprotein component of BamABCDE complex)
MTAPFTGPAKSCEVLTMQPKMSLPAPAPAPAPAFALAFAVAFAACLCAPRLSMAAEDAKPPSAASVRAIDPQVLAKVVPGISKTQVKSLLGDPWRTVQYNDDEEIENEFWEYRGKDSHGTYRVHIEFDQQNTVVIVGKIPDKVAGGKGTPAKS